MYTYNDDLFLDGIAPTKMSYQIFITCVQDEIRNLTFMTSWTFLSGKTKEDYIIALREINNNINRICNKDNMEKNRYYPKYCHSDYEIAIWSSCQYIWKDTQIKNCNFHRCNNLQQYRTAYFNNLYNSDEKIKKTYCMVRALCYINPKYVSYCLTKLNERHTEPEIKEFINYYKKTYAFDNSAILRSNYYGRNKHRTNNISEGNNNKLNHLFNKKPSTIRLIFELRFEESYFKSLFDKINEGEVVGHRKRKKSYDRQLYIDIATNNIKDICLLNGQKELENEIGNIWFNCLKNLSKFEHDILYG